MFSIGRYKQSVVSDMLLFRCSWLSTTSFNLIWSQKILHSCQSSSWQRDAQNVCALTNVSTVLKTSCLVTDGLYYCDLVTNGMYALGLICDAEKDQHERFFCPCSAINGCYKIPLNEPEIKFSFCIFDPPVAYFYKFFMLLAGTQYYFVCWNITYVFSS